MTDPKLLAEQAHPCWNCGKPLPADEDNCKWCEWDPLHNPMGWKPLSVREGNIRQRTSWRAKELRERVALRLAPWLTPTRTQRY